MTSSYRFFFIVAVALLSASCIPDRGDYEYHFRGGDERGNREDMYPAPPEPVVPVRIGEVDWAPCNVAEAGAFTDTPEEFGGLFPWGVDPCPEGWRVPTEEELFSLLSTRDQYEEVWVTRDGVAGLAVRSAVAGDGIFLPAAGFLRTTAEPVEPSSVGERGYYWSTSSNLDTSGVNLQIGPIGATKSMGNSRKFGYSIRCVKK